MEFYVIHREPLKDERITIERFGNVTIAKARYDYLNSRIIPDNESGEDVSGVMMINGMISAMNGDSLIE